MIMISSFFTYILDNIVMLVQSQTYIPMKHFTKKMTLGLTVNKNLFF